MNWHGPVPISLARPESKEARFEALFSHLDLRVYLTEAAYVDVGAGSSSALRLFRYVPFGFSGCAGRVGRYCEFADCTLFVGGEHPNHQPVNVEFGFESLLGGLAYHAFGVPKAHPVSIGDNVIVSKDANVLSGAAVQTGAVVAAGAVVTRDVGAFEVVGGVPAKILKARFPDKVRMAVERVRWWDFHPAYLAENMHRLQELAVTDGPHRYRPVRPRLVLRLEAGTLSFIGLTINGETRPNAELPSSMEAYIRHSTGAGPFFWRADPWQE